MKKRIVFIVFAILLFFAVIAGGVTKYMENPVFCGNCHLMQTRYISYKRSVHNQAVCKDCHSEPGCVSCHNIRDIDRKTEKNFLNRKGFAHKNHAVSYKISCKACHGGMMHVKMDGTSENPDEVCKNCHMQTEFTENRLSLQ